MCLKRISEKEKTDIGTITRKYRYKLPKITNSNFLVYYDFNGDAKRKEKDLRGKSILEIRQYIEYWENHKKRR